ncbi:MAG: helix-turn-helix domain-containing protein [Propionibacteriales bacterium]|nr:helix-turn-helix domain-containing protein [Propionibacteriales bacterium]
MPLGGETSQTLDRGIRVLHLVAASGSRGLSVSELATRLAVGRPVVYRLVATLTAHDLVRRFADGQIRLGLGLLPLAAATHSGLREAATPVLRRLADETGATAHLTIADHNEGIAIAVEEPRWSDVHVRYRVGSRHSLDRGAAGKAISRGRDGVVGVTETHDELQAGARGFAVPVVGIDGLEASVGVVTVGSLAAERVSARLSAAARELAAALR